MLVLLNRRMPFYTVLIVVAASMVAIMVGSSRGRTTVEYTYSCYNSGSTEPSKLTEIRVLQDGPVGGAYRFAGAEKFKIAQWDERTGVFEFRNVFKRRFDRQEAALSYTNQNEELTFPIETSGVIDGPAMLWSELITKSLGSPEVRDRLSKQLSINEPIVSLKWNGLLVIGTSYDTGRELITGSIYATRGGQVITVCLSNVVRQN